MPLHLEATLSLGRGASLRLGPRPLLMGILNVTPDSFSDGGLFLSAEAILAQARRLADAGADILDIGGESTRPGAEEVPVQAELDRVMPALDLIAAADLNLPVSIDTYKALVADQAIQAGARIVNDVHGLRRDPEIAAVAALYGVPLILMHWDKERDRSADIIAEMQRYFEVSLAIADRAGVARSQIVLDPGFGFAKTLSENFEILRRLEQLAGLGFPLLVGTSRKTMIGKVTGRPVEQRLAGTIASNVLAYRAGGQIFRVHDIAGNRDALLVAQACLYGPDALEL